MAKAEAKSAHTQASVWNTYAHGTTNPFRLLQMFNTSYLFLITHRPPRSLSPINLQMEGCLTTDEASKFISSAEQIGFQHQGIRGAAYGEVSSLEKRKKRSVSPNQRLSS